MRPGLFGYISNGLYVHLGKNKWLQFKNEKRVKNILTSRGQNIIKNG